MANKIATLVSIFLLIVLIALPIVFRDEVDKVTQSQQEEAQNQAQQQPSQEQQESEPLTVNYNLDEVTLVGHTDGIKQWELKVNGVTDEGKETTTLLNLKDGELFQSGKTRFYLSAETGEYNRQRDQFSLRNNVVVKGVQGETIQTNELFYDNNTHQVRSGPVNLEQDQSKVRAGQMNIDVDNEVFEFENGVEIDFTIDEDETDPTTTETKGGVVDAKSQNP